MTISRIELFQVIREVIYTVTDIDPQNILLARQNKPAPSGAYCTVEPKRTVRQKGQANTYRSNGVSDSVEVQVRAQIICEAEIQFYRGDAFNEAEKLNQANKRPDISQLLFENGVGWNSVGESIDLSALQSENQELRVGKTIVLMYETSPNPVIQNNVLCVPFAFDAILNGSDEILEEGEIGACLEPEALCPSLGLEVFIAAPNTTIVITDESIDFAGQVAAAPEGVICGVSAVTPFSLNGLNTWFETTITAVDGVNTHIGTCINIFAKTGLDGVVIKPNIGGVAEGYACSELFSPSPTPLAGFVNTSLTLPYTVQTRLNGATGEISYADTAGNSGSLGIYPTLNSELLFLNPIGISSPEQAGYTGLESGTYNLNASYIESIIPVPVGFEGYCIIDPPAIQCTPSVLSLLTFSGSQTTVIDGQNVLATSLGNAFDGGIQSDQTWQTGTKNVHIELEVNDFTVASPDFTFGLVFSDGNTIGANLMAGVFITPDFGGVMIDVVSGTPIAFPFIFSGYKVAIYIDGQTGTARVIDNGGNDLAISVNPLWTPSTVIYMGAPFYAGSEIGDFLDITFNLEGNPVFQINPQANRWCDPDPVVPPSLYCTPMNFSVLTVSPDPQTANVTGLFAETISQGFPNAVSGFLGNEIFTIGTKNVHIEMKVDNWGVGGGQQLGILFANFAPPNDPPNPPEIFAGVIYIEAIGQLLDFVAGVPIAFPAFVVDDTYRLALYLDGTSTATMRDNRGNIASVGVSLGFSNGFPLQAAALIGAGGTLGNQTDATFNFGSSEFAISPQEDKWCD